MGILTQSKFLIALVVLEIVSGFKVNLVRENNDFDFLDSQIGTSPENPAASCNDVYRRSPGAASGVYYVYFGNGVVFPVACNFWVFPGRGATLVYKINSAVPGNAATLWSNQVGVNENDTSLMNTYLSSAHYVSSILQNATFSRVTQASMRVYINGTEMQYINFKVNGNINFFNPANVTNSSWIDLPTQPNWDGSAQGRYFSIVSSSDGRTWYINNNWGGCNYDQGWMLVSSGSDPCDPYYFHYHPKIAIFFSNSSAMSALGTGFVFADVLALWVDVEDLSDFYTVTTVPTGGGFVQINGLYFGNSTDDIEIYIGKAACTNITMPIIDVQLQCYIAPGGGGNYPVSIIQNGIYLDYNVTFSYANPSIDNATVIPQSGGMVVISGNSFGSDPSLISVEINEISCVNVMVVIPHVQISCLMVAGSGRMLPIVVTVEGLVSAPAPIFSYLTPIWGNIGDTPENPAASCNDVLRKRGNLGQGVFYVSFGINNSFPVLCDFSVFPGRAATMVYKLNSGVPGDAATLWTNGYPVNDTEMNLLTTQISSQHFVSRILQYWYRVNQASVRVYQNGVAQQFINFNVNGSNPWFQPQNVISSSWTDLPKSAAWQGSGSGKYFSIVPPDYPTRTWYINNNWGGCPNDQGWMLVSWASDTCDGEWFQNMQKIVIYYANQNHISHYGTSEFSFADTFVVWADVEDISPNLVEDPNCDNNIFTGWNSSTSSNSWGCSTTETHYHPYSIFAGATSYSSIYQVVNISAYSEEIDSITGMFFTFSLWTMGYPDSPMDQGDFSVLYMGEGGEILDEFSVPPFAPLQWAHYYDARIVPAGSRYIKVTLSCTRNSGWNCDAYYNDVSINAGCVLLPSSPSNLPCVSSSSVPAYSTSYMTYLTPLANLTATYNPMCKFGNLISIGTYLTSAAGIQCTIPPMGPGVYSFDVSLDFGETWIPTGQTHSVAPPRLAGATSYGVPELDFFINQTTTDITWAPLPNASAVDIILAAHVSFHNGTADMSLTTIMIILGPVATALPNNGYATVDFADNELLANLSSSDDFMVSAVTFLISPSSPGTKMARGLIQDFKDLLNLYNLMKFDMDAWKKLLTDFFDGALPLSGKLMIFASKLLGWLQLGITAYDIICYGNNCGPSWCPHLHPGTWTDSVDQACLNYKNCLVADNGSPTCVNDFIYSLEHTFCPPSSGFTCEAARLGMIYLYTYGPSVLSSLGSLYHSITGGTPGGAGGWGDVHYTSFDGCYFTFNGQGEYTLLEAWDSQGLTFTLQARTLPYSQFPGATLTQALAMRCSQYDPAISLYANDGDAEVRVDGMLMVYSVGMLNRIPRGFLTKTGPGSFQIQFDTGFSVQVDMIDSVPDRFWTITISAPPSVYNNTRGIYGVWDGTTADDFTFSNGTVYPCGSYVNSFGFSWAVEMSNSLFWYGDNYTYINPNGTTPVNTPQWHSIEQEKEAMILCSVVPENFQDSCLFDISIMNTTAVVNGTQIAGSAVTALTAFPSNITYQATNSSIEVSWTTPEGNYTTDVQWSSGDAWNVALTASNSTYANITSLQAGVEYQIRLRANSAEGNPSGWVVVQATTVGCAPNCNFAFCGDDGCGGSCGNCTIDTYCTQNRTCLNETDTFTQHVYKIKISDDEEFEWNKK